MPLTTIGASEAMASLGRFDAIIDARSEGEYALDRLPGAVNWPSLNDAERALVGTVYAQISAFEARKRGAALVARNVAAHVERHLADIGREWSPLVYCWRGGERSGALATVLARIGFRVHVLEGGYRAWRRALVESLATLPAGLDLRVVCGPTGSGKSRLLAALAAQGEQVLDLERLANHRGSVLGLVPGSRQPAQKAFDSRVWEDLNAFDATRPVFVESESPRIGSLRLPESLVERMRASPCLWLELPLAARVALLIEDYAFFVDDTEAFCERLAALRALRGNAVVESWQEAARAGRTAEVVRALLESHYDPIYRQSMRRNFHGLAQPARVVAWDGSAASLHAAAAALRTSGCSGPGLSACAGRR